MRITVEQPEWPIASCWSCDAVPWSGTTRLSQPGKTSNGYYWRAALDRNTAKQKARPVSAARTQAVLLFLVREPFEDEFLLLRGDKTAIHQLLQPGLDISQDLSLALLSEPALLYRSVNPGLNPL